MESQTEFGRLLDALHLAGIKTKSARGFWGGIAADGTIVSTAWTDTCDERGRYRISRPLKNHGGLKAVWDAGGIQPGTQLRIIMVRQAGTVGWGKGGRKLTKALLTQGMWEVVELATEADRTYAYVRPSAG